MPRVVVPVANLWSSPEMTRAVDAPALLDAPQTEQWLADLDARPDNENGEGRVGLHRRLQTQAVAGEPVLLLDQRADGWARVCLPWQPTRLDPRGYPGWVRSAHLSQGPGSDDADSAPVPTRGDSPSGLLALAREQLGLPYLWGGTTALGLDCSGLVHWALRQQGRVVPRDADDQEQAAHPVALDDVRPGDLYFFTPHNRRTAHHVGIVTARGRMIHAPETGAGIVEEPLPPRRWETLSGAGRLGPTV